VRREVHRRGLRYLVDASLPGIPRRRADLLFRRERVAVFVDGCFWHGCPEHGTSPRSNASWWQDKFEANRRRDQDTDRRLAELGWVSVRCWEHEDPNEAADRIERVVLERRRLLM
jgi:DNA mismatch endonuclease (patch repair protein)